ncbi:MSC_0620 family F1-like ATPase-associated subunit [Mycoplasma amphoriforme]|uniref:Uncharacterized protein n=1 Tax=Mycoplasma amphoriforme A39 TaxID=572419 RepID=A0A292IJU6_9MOLU|nr:unnamed protein product [Mycoplasma amphoriforme A39]
MIKTKLKKSLIFKLFGLSLAVGAPAMLLINQTTPKSHVPSLRQVIHDVTKSQPPLVSKEHEQNQTYFKTQLKTSLENLIKKVQERIDDELTKKDKDAKDTSDKLNYYLQLRKFLNTNKQAILQNPKKYGFEFNFPSVLTNPKYSVGSITTNGKTIDGVVFGGNVRVENGDHNASLGYNETAGSSLKQSQTIDNKIDSTEYKKKYDKYAAALETAENIDKIFLNEKDFPKNGENYHENVKNENGELVKNGLSDLTINGKEQTWDEYFISKIKRNFLDFDIQQNKMLQPQSASKKDDTPSPDVEKTQPSPSENPNQNTTIADQKPAPIGKVEEIRNIRDLKPQVVPRFSNFQVYDFVNKYNQALLTEKMQLVYFDNPVYKRFTYDLKQLNADNNTAKGTVTVFDKLLPTNSHSYQSQVQGLLETDHLLQNQNLLYYLAYEQVSQIVNKIQDSLALDNKLDISHLLGFNTVQKIQIQNAFYLLTKIYFDESTGKTYKKDLYNLSNKYVGLSLSDTDNLNDFKRAINGLFLSYVVTSKIDQFNFANYLQTLYVSKINNLLTGIKTNYQIFSKKLATLNFASTTVLNLINRLQTTTNLIKQFNFLNVDDASKISLFEKMVDLVIKSNHLYQPLFNILQIAMNEKTLENKTERQIQQDLNSLIQELTYPANVTAGVLTITGIILISVIAVVIFLRYKKFKKTQFTKR